MNKFLGWLIVPLLAFSIAGCGGGSSGDNTGESGGGSGGSGDTSIPGLAIAEQMSLVTADTSGSSSLSSALHALAVAVKNANRTDLGGDFATDVGDVYVDDDSMTILEIPNEILCELDQTHYWEMVNQGAQLTYVDLSRCEQSDDHQADLNNESTGQALKLEPWILRVTRECTTCDQIIEMWVQIEDEDDYADEIRGKMIISEGDTATNPFGTFTAHFAEYKSGEIIFTGSLAAATTDSDLIDLQLAFDAGDFESGNLHGLFTLNESGGFATGAAYGVRSFTGEGFNEMEKSVSAAESPGARQEATMQVAFDESHYLTHGEMGGQSKDRCLDRNNYEETVWRYNIYDANGTRKSLNGGMPIRYGEEWGWAGHFGIWLGDNRPTNGMTVTNEEGDTSYTVFVAPGRLTRRTLVERTLADFTGTSIHHWDDSLGSDILMTWNGTNFVKTGVQTCTNNGPCTFTATDEEILTFNTCDWVGGWVEEIGGSFNVDNPCVGGFESEQGPATFTDDTAVFVRLETFVTPNDSLFANGDATFQCFDQCLKPNPTQADYDSGDLFLPFLEEDDNPYLYTIGDDLDMKYQGESVTFTGSVSEGSPNQWGAGSWDLVPGDVELAGSWEVWDQEVLHAYEAGPNDWNHYTALLDSNGNAVSFDPPLRCRYGIYEIEYAGEGELHIPWEVKETMDDGSERWGPAFSLADGTELDCSGNPHYTKAMEKELRMVEVAESFCADLTSALSSISPATIVYEDPNIGDAPTVTSAPAFVGGVAQ